MSLSLTYELIRSRRKTLTIHITAEGRVIVRAPLKLPKAEIDKVLMGKERWIRTHLTKMKQKLADKESFVLDYGTPIILLGESYIITVGKGKKVGISEPGEHMRQPKQTEVRDNARYPNSEFVPYTEYAEERKSAQTEVHDNARYPRAELVPHTGYAEERKSAQTEVHDNVRYPNSEFVPHTKYAEERKSAQAETRKLLIPSDLSSDEIKKLVIRFYRKAARQILDEKVTHYSEKMGLYPTAVKITGAKTRWGSCSGKNSISFSWRLILAADDVVDYVVIHELAHIKEHNHSDRFWAIVESQTPDYRDKKKALKLLQERLSSQDWD